jgi:Amt family ammonium transporter
MGKKIIAECVEKESTIDLLRGMGVDYVQGYAIARPKPLKNLLTESG